MFVRNVSTSEEVVVVTGFNNQAINTVVATVVGTAIDMSGYQNVAFVCLSPADVVAANTPILSAKYGANTSTTIAVANSSVPVGANTTTQVLELARPSYRYVAPQVICGAKNTTVTVIAILSGREPQSGGTSPTGNPNSQMIPQNSSFNTTTGVFGGVANTQSSLNTPTSIVLLANP